MILGELKYGLLFLLIPFLVAGIFYLHQWKKEKRLQFAQSKFHRNLFGEQDNLKSFITNVLIISSLCFIIIGLVDILFGSEKKTVKREGVDIVFALDLSKSMNTQDVAPSRLEKAKNIITQTMKKLGGDRVALVGFAGNAYTLLPLTNDYNAVENAISNLESNIMERQGTNLEEALSESALSLKSKSTASKVIIVLSDGEDNEDGKGNAVAIANDYDIAVIGIGIGTENGAPIPDYEDGREIGNVIDNEGNIVISKKQTDVLKEVADETNGFYIDGITTQQTVNEVMNYLSHLKKNKMGETQNFDAKHYFQWFLGIGLLLLLLALFIENFEKQSIIFSEK